MRNLKKILALALALVMSLSVMSVASADFKDADSVTDQYKTAVDVLSGLGVFEGDEKGNFNPKGSITRAEVAAIIYRIDTGDVNDERFDIYSDYNKFKDVKSTDWFAGYVNYCANALYINGYDETTFGPNDKVTGYQALAMILRAVGYDKNNEFSGSAWQLEVARYASKLGITNTVNSNTLGVPATREMVAELLFRTICFVPQVTYTLALGYNQYQSTLIDANSKLNPTIGEEMFGLTFHENVIIDDWGRPGDYWYASKGVNRGVVAFYPYAPVATYTEAVTECEIAVDLGYNGKIDVPTIYWDNGVEKTIGINPVHEHINVKGHQVGGTGTLVEVYERNPDTNADDTIVLIETYLAKVTDTTAQVTDKAGHIKVPATNTLYVYTGADEPVDWRYQIEGNNYATGDYVLVYVNEGLEYVVDHGVANSVVAAQTTIWWNAEKHSLDKVEYLDNENFQLDAAQYDMSKKYTWFLDLYGNVIGDVELLTPKTYAIVLGAQWINAPGENGYAQATLRYLDGTSEGAKIDYVDDKPTQYADTFSAGDPDKTFENGYVFTTWQYNTMTNKHLYEVVDLGDGYVALTKVPAHFENATIVDGVSQVVAANGTFYTNNFTKYVIYDKVTKQYIEVNGYDNMPATYAADYIDVLFNGNNNFASFVYIYGTVKTTAPEDVVKSEFIYFTGDNMNFYELKDTFALYGVVNVNCEANPLHFLKNTYGSEETTRTMLLELMKLYQDTLCLVTTTNGIVTDVTPVSLINGMTIAKQNVLFCEADEYSFFNDSGVLMVKNTLALNVNQITTIINDGEIGTAVDLTEATLLGRSIYVIYTGTTATTIFITDTTYGHEMNLLYRLTAQSFVDLTSKPYEGELTAEAIAAAVEENSVAINFIKALGRAELIEVNPVEIVQDNGRFVTVRIALRYTTFDVDSEMAVENVVDLTFPIAL